MHRLMLAAVAITVAAPALAEDRTPMWDSAPVLAVQREIEAECRTMGLQAKIVPDFLFAVDADGDGQQDDAIMFAAVAQCVDRLDDQPTVEREVFCNADACRQWLVINDRRGYRLAWTGFTPALSGVSDLRRLDERCSSAQSITPCPRVYWNGTGFTERRPRRRR